VLIISEHSLPCYHHCLIPASPLLSSHYGMILWQTLESLNLLKMRKTPFIIALNKVDRLFDWKEQGEAVGIRAALAAQQPHVLREYEERLQKCILSINEQGLNAAIYYDNPDPRR
jgi:translation initiation factor 5B